MKIYNSLTEKNEALLPFNASSILVYSCGVTSRDHPYLEQTIVALRCNAIWRYLSHKGYEVAVIDSYTNNSLPKRAIDIHCGDHNHLSSRHERENVQCKVRDSQLPTKYWMYLGSLKVDGEKMHKLSNDAASLQDGLEEYGKELITWVVLRHHYRSSIELNDKLFRDNLNILRDFYINISPSVMSAVTERPDTSDSKVKELLSGFEKEMDNDFNSPGALVLLTRYLEEAITLRIQGKNSTNERLEGAIVYLGRILGLFQAQNLIGLTSAMLIFQQRALNTPEIITVEDIDRLIGDRRKAQENKEYSKADHVCNLLKLHGVAIVDDADKDKWKFTTN